MNEGKTLAKESEVLISEAKKSVNSTITYDVKLIAEGKAPQKDELNIASLSSKNVSWPDDKI